MLIRYLLRSKTLAIFAVVAVMYLIKNYFFGPDHRELIMHADDPFKKIENFFNTLFFWFTISAFAFAYLMEMIPPFQNFICSIFNAIMTEVNERQSRR